jgi:adenosylcobinamide-phosphate synthase
VGLSREKVMLLALGLDLLLGEPDEWWHPVVWMGRLVARIERAAPESGRNQQLLYGAATEGACLGAAVLPALAAERLFRGWGWAGIALSAAMLKPVFAVRALFEHGRRVEDALTSGDLPLARGAVGMIVSRDVAGLDEPLVAAAAVESLAENSSDSVVAPLLFYSLFGLPGAYLYRMANTLDAMLGYRGKYEYLGKVAARTDDLLNLIPARLTALAMALASPLVGGSPVRTWRAALRDSGRTASPNAGWPMASASGALDLRLEKADHYVLNPEGKLPDGSDIGRARRLVAEGALVAVAGALLLSRRLR